MTFTTEDLNLPDPTGHIPGEGKEEEESQAFESMEEMFEELDSEDGDG